MEKVHVHHMSFAPMFRNWSKTYHPWCTRPFQSQPHRFSQEQFDDGRSLPVSHWTLLPEVHRFLMKAPLLKPSPINISYELTVLLSLDLENRPSCMYAFANIFVTFAAWLDLAASNSCVENLEAKFLTVFSIAPVAFGRLSPAPSTLAVLAVFPAMGPAVSTLVTSGLAFRSRLQIYLEEYFRGHKAFFFVRVAYRSRHCSRRAAKCFGYVKHQLFSTRCTLP